MYQRIEGWKILAGAVRFYSAASRVPHSRPPHLAESWTRFECSPRMRSTIMVQFTESFTVMFRCHSDLLEECSA